MAANSAKCARLDQGIAPQRLDSICAFKLPGMRVPTNSDKT